MVHRKLREPKAIGKDVPHWMKRQYVLESAAREKREKEIQQMNEQARRMGRRPPMTKEQKSAGARRIA